jgi:tetratricopeptide (TPR) repeat protein
MPPLRLDEYMSNDPAPSRRFRIVAALFELIEGRRNVRSTVHELQQALRGNDPALDQFLEGLEGQSLEEWAANLADTAARVQATSQGRGTAPAEVDGAGSAERPLAAVIRHPSSPGGSGPRRSGEPSGRSAHDYSAAFAAVAGRSDADAERVAAERTRVAREIKRLMAIRSPRQRAEEIKNSRRPATRNPLLVEGLLEEACRVRGASPQLAREVTEAAVLASHRVHPRHGRPLCWRLQKRAEAHRANVLRLLGELPAADAAWRRINEHIAVEPIDVPDEEAELRSLEASLRIDLRQFERAEVLLERAEGLYREVGDWVGVARVLMKRGSAALYGGDPRRAAELHRSARQLLDPEADPRLFIMCSHNLAHSLLELGDSVGATDLLQDRPELLKQVDDPAIHLRQRWIEAQIVGSGSHWQEAERLYLEVRNGWLAHQRPYEAALATLDLAEMHLARGDFMQVKRRASLLVPLFEMHGVHREARAALILFHEAAKAELLTREYLTCLRRYLRFAPRDHRLSFDPAARPAGW